VRRIRAEVRRVRFMFRFILRHKGRIAAFALSFAAGLLAAFAFRAAFGLLTRRAQTGATEARVTQTPPCASADAFASPEEVAAALKSDDVGVRREMFRRLFVLPGLATAYYDYERDKDFPERAEGLELRRVNLDDSPDEEAVINFVRVESPVAVVLKRGGCGWKAVAAVSSWLRFEEYPYADWMELPEAIRPGQHVLLVRDSTGDATRYTRRARVLRLVGGQLEQVAEVDEESITPVEGYNGADWAEVKRRRVGGLAFVQPSGDSPAGLRVKYGDEVVRYSGVEPASTYWREGDGVWHEAQRHWRTRRFETLKPAASSEERFIWSEQESRFVPAGP
jgi:hypothetical protein